MILSLKLALRFIKARQGATLSSFMSLASTVGIAIGVLALITGLSAMNGFEYELQNRILSVIPQVQVKAQAKSFDNASLEAQKLMASSEQIEAVAPVVELSAIIHNHQDFHAVGLLGIDESENQVINIEKFLTISLQDLNQNFNDLRPIVLGKALAENFGLKIGDKIQIMNLDLEGSHSSGNDLSRAIQGISSYEFTLVGTLSIGGQLDNNFAITSLNTARAIGNLKSENTLHVKTTDFLRCLPIVYQSSNVLTQRATLTSWMASQGKLYNDIQMIRSVMYLAMIMVMMVACFNIIGTLYMLVSERRDEIAILLTLGFKRQDIMKTFTLVGLIKGAIGTLIGAILGILLSLNLTTLTTFLEQLLNTKFLNENIYFISFIPSRLGIFDVMLVICTALMMSILAALFPAFKASRTDPAQILNG